VRLHEMGAPIVGLPGAAIWHEPFYTKLNGWQLYYETRNMLVAAAIHFPRHRLRLSLLLLKRLLIYLLTYRYYSAALVLRAIEDYLEGPSVYERQPQAIHASLDRDKTKFPPEEFAREQVARERRLLRDPRTFPGFVFRIVWAILRNWIMPSRRTSVPVRIESRDLVWFRVAWLDQVVVETHWDARLPVFRRSRTAFRELLVRGVRLLIRVARDGDAVARSWRQAHPRFTGEQFWRRYLGLQSRSDESAVRIPEEASPMPPTP
jgi:galactofuranosylgalactofuranosylrhamnosyl-N-acetylglucosaminyl-diphospho-decaprenol beta-1,5/1,6-galactofuranosyltransferase